MKEYRYTKYAGAGNDFVVIDATKEALAVENDAITEFVRQACSRRDGAGSDGLILLRPSERAPFRMDFYNPDGSFGALCGNGARCAVQAANDAGLVLSRAPEFEVLGAINHAELLDDGTVKVYFQDPTFIKTNFMLRMGKKQFIRSSYVDLGSQHSVTFFEELSQFTGQSIEEFDIVHYGSMIRWHVDFAHKGVNANFIEVRSDELGAYLRIRTFERGVEGETLACGTGCMSSAIVARLLGRTTEGPARLKTQSGEFVKVDFKLHDGAVRNLSLEGSAVRGESGTILW